MLVHNSQIYLFSKKIHNIQPAKLNMNTAVYPFCALQYSTFASD